jgi:hypothetical protein
VTVGYYGSKGTNLIGAFELNDLAPGYAISKRCDGMCDRYFHDADRSVSSCGSRVCVGGAGDSARSAQTISRLSIDQHCAAEIQLPITTVCRSSGNTVSPEARR